MNEPTSANLRTSPFPAPCRPVTRGSPRQLPRRWSTSIPVKSLTLRVARLLDARLARLAAAEDYFHSKHHSRIDVHECERNV